LYNTELISKVIDKLKCGRASDTDGLMAEHLMKAHPVLPVILSKLFRLIFYPGMFQQPLDTVMLIPFLNLRLDSVNHLIVKILEASL